MFPAVMHITVSCKGRENTAYLPANKSNAWLTLTGGSRYGDVPVRRLTLEMPARGDH
jgi:hypothetical protein